MVSDWTSEIGQLKDEVLLLLDVTLRDSKLNLAGNKIGVVLRYGIVFSDKQGLLRSCNFCFTFGVFDERTVPSSLSSDESVEILWLAFFVGSGRLFSSVSEMVRLFDDSISCSRISFRGSLEFY